MDRASMPPPPQLTQPFDLLAGAQPWLLAVWVGVLGASIGSFLNVVIYRVPRRMSLVHPGSHCPACGKPIRWYHNLPLFGWLILGGRCHDCQAAISPRYPMIEAVTSVLFLSLAWAGPLDHPALDEPVDLSSYWSTVTLWTLLGYHLVMLCTVLCLAMIDRDRAVDRALRFPGGLVIGVTVAGLVIPAAWRLYVPDASHAMGVGPFSPKFPGMLASVAGGLTAIVYSAVASPAMVGQAMVAGRTHRTTRAYAASSLWVVGLFLGPRPVAEIAAATAVFYCLVTCFPRIGGRLTWPRVLFAVAWVWTVFRLPTMVPTKLPAPWRDTLADLLGLVLLTGLVSLICWYIHRRRTHS